MSINLKQDINEILNLEELNKKYLPSQNTLNSNNKNNKTINQSINSSNKNEKEKILARNKSSNVLYKKQNSSFFNQQKSSLKTKV